MIITFLEGHQLFRTNKTGVQNVHYNLIKKLSKDNDLSKKSQIIVFAKHRVSSNNFFGIQIKCHKPIISKLIKLLPAELFLGQSNIYFIDGNFISPLSKGKKIALIHDMMAFIYPRRHNLIDTVVERFYYHRCKKSDLIITPSSCTKNDIIKYLGIDENKIKIIPNGYEKDSVLHKENINLKGPYFFSIGAMRNNKNLLNSIKAFEKTLNIFRKNNKEVYYYIVGDKKFEYDALVNYVGKNKLENNVIFTGYLDDCYKDDLFANSIGLLYVSTYEGFGIPIIEAANYHTPVITSNCSSMKEIAGGYCITVNPYNIDEISEQMIKLFNDDFRNKIIKNQNKLINMYTWDITYKQYKETFLSFK